MIGGIVVDWHARYHAMSAAQVHDPNYRVDGLVLDDWNDLARRMVC